MKNLNKVAKKIKGDESTDRLESVLSLKEKNK